MGRCITKSGGLGIVHGFSFFKNGKKEECWISTVVFTDGLVGLGLLGTHPIGLVARDREGFLCFSRGIGGCSRLCRLLRNGGSRGSSGLLP